MTKLMMVLISDAVVDWRVWALGAVALAVNILGAAEFWLSVILRFTI